MIVTLENTKNGERFATVKNSAELENLPKNYKIIEIL